MPINTKDPVPPPVIGKIGPYTVFMTPPSTPKPPEGPPEPSLDSPSSPVQPPVQAPPPPVQPPPQQFQKPVPAHPLHDGSLSGYFKSAVTKVQNAHSSLDDHLARWFGLNQSKYQWALDDYYNNKVLEKEGGKPKEVSAAKLQNV
ncbi:pollen-specific leucine-rich repeat extensin-like protein 1 [Punica granatum]|uniref:Pollen-specific leucine-rich repeat extensin-like protein 1 n=1 Tax=Punica granatum TaxID=22663 RepID=A0A6P8C6R7_PUNGR|nr:pollen-specific leucine-rich repeat extensin-like protein 1 [Punica granatum]